MPFYCFVLNGFFITGEMTDLPESDEENVLLNSDVSETGSLSSESLSENEDDLLVEQNNFNNEE